MFVVCVDVYIYFSFVPVGQSLRSFSPLLPGNDCSSLLATHASEHCLPFSPALVRYVVSCCGPNIARRHSSSEKGRFCFVLLSFSFGKNENKKTSFSLLLFCLKFLSFASCHFAQHARILQSFFINSVQKERWKKENE